MLQKESYLRVTDSTGVGWLLLYHVYRGSWRRYANVGNYVRMSVKNIVRYPIRRRGMRYRPIRPGFRVRGLVVNLVKTKSFYDSSRLITITSSCVLLKKSGMFKSKHFRGPITRNVRYRKYYNKFYYFI